MRGPVTFTATANQPARQRTAVIICCDEGYLPYATFVAQQIAVRHSNPTFDICICSTQNISLPDSLRDLPVRLCQVDVGSAFDDLGTAGHVTATTYLRLALPKAFSTDYDRLLYLDCDVSILSNRLDDLLSCDLAGHPVGAVRDNTQWRKPGRMPREFPLFGLPQAPYFNAGVMVMDVRAWLHNEVTLRALDLGVRFAGRLRYADQSLLNGVLHRNWAEVSPVWNWQQTSKTAFFGTLCDLQIVHFIGPCKPWNDTAGEIAPQFVRPLAAFLAQHFPAKVTPLSTSTAATDASRMRRMLWKHAVAAGPMARYLAHFPDDQAVVG